MGFTVQQGTVCTGDANMQKITPFLWLDDKAKDAAHFYTSIFKNSKIGEIMRYGEGGMGTPGSVMTVSFQIEGQNLPLWIADRTFPSHRPSPSSSVANRKQKWMSYGQNSLEAARRCNAAG